MRTSRDLLLAYWNVKSLKFKGGNPLLGLLVDKSNLFLKSNLYYSVDVKKHVHIDKCFHSKNLYSNKSYHKLISRVEVELSHLYLFCANKTQKIIDVSKYYKAGVVLYNQQRDPAYNIE
jgi:predicted thioredoxin/glutaredoxin